MTRTQIPEALGQQIPVQRMNDMARTIAHGIGDGRPTSYAGFLWYRPQGLFQQNLHHMSREQATATRRAA
jgi:hypothetical protein